MRSDEFVSNCKNIVLFSLLFLAFCVLPAYADGGVAATVIAERGDVSVTRGGTSLNLPLNAGQPLYIGDTVRTSANGEVEVLFQDGSDVKLDNNSKILVSRSAPSVRSQNLFQAVIGVIWAHLRPGSIIQTPSANIVVRGTEVALNIASDGTTELAVVSGDVSFVNGLGSVDVQANQQSTARPGEAPTAPVAVDATGLISWTADIVGLPLVFEFQPTSVGDNLRVKGDAEGALQSYSAVLAQNPADLDASVGTALTELSQGRPDSARAALTAVAANPEAIAVSGLIDLETGNAGAAQTEFESSLTGDPTLYTADSLLALTDLQLGLIADAESAARKGVALAPRSAESQGALSTVLFFEGKTGEAAAASRKAVAANSRSPFALLTEGRCSVVRGSYQLAREQYESSLAFAPRLWLVHQELGDVYEQLDNPKKAAEEYEIALQLDPNSHDAYVGLGKSQEDLGQFDAARVDFKKAIAIDPDDVSARYYYSSFLVDQGDLDGAVIQIETVAGNDTKLGLIYARLAEIYLYKQDLFKAQKYAVKAVKLLPNSAIAHYELGRVYFEQERIYQAEEEFRLATVLDPRLSKARYALGLVQEKTSSELLQSFSTIFDSAYVGSPASSTELTDLETPGANERIQAEVAEPSAVRSASRSYGDTEFDGVIGNNRSYDAAGSYLTDSGGHRVAGINAGTQFDGGPRPNADTTLNTANLVYGKDSLDYAPGYVLLADYEQTELGQDNGVYEDPGLASSRFHTQLLRFTAGLNVKTGDAGRLLAVFQGANALYGTSTGLQPTDPSGAYFSSHADNDLLDAELRWDAVPEYSNNITVGLSYGTRRKLADSYSPNVLAGGLAAYLFHYKVAPLQAYVRDTINPDKKLSFIGQLQYVQENPYENSVAVNPEFPAPFNSSSTPKSVILPYVIASYRSDRSDIIRIRYRRILGYQTDFELLKPIDDFLISFTDLPQPLEVNASGVGAGTSTEVEYDKTLRNGSFLSVGVFRQNLLNADIDSPEAAVLGQYGAVTVQGAQSRFQCVVNNYLTASLLAEYDDSEQKDIQQRIMYVPQLDGVGTLQYLGRSGSYWQLAYYYQGDRLVYDPFFNTIQSGSFGILDARIGKRFGLRTNIFAEIDNAFNKQYDLQGIQEPGFEIKTGISQRY